MNVEYSTEIEPKFEEYPYVSHREGSWKNGLCLRTEADMLGLFSYHFLTGTLPEAGHMVSGGEPVAFAFRSRSVEIEGYGRYDSGWPTFFIVRSSLERFENHIAVYYPGNGNYRTRPVFPSFNESIEEAEKDANLGSEGERRFHRKTLELIELARGKLIDSGQGDLSHRELFDYLVLDFESRYFKNAWSPE